MKFFNLRPQSEHMIKQNVENDKYNNEIKKTNKYKNAEYSGSQRKRYKVENKRNIFNERQRKCMMYFCA